MTACTPRETPATFHATDHSMHYFGRQTVLDVLIEDPDPHTQFVCGILSLTDRETAVAIRETNEYRVMCVGRECVWLTHEMFERINRAALVRRIRETNWA